MNIAKVSANGQISLPIEVRKILGVELGDKVISVQNKKGEMVIKSVASTSLMEEDE